MMKFSKIYIQILSILIIKCFNEYQAAEVCEDMIHPSYGDICPYNLGLCGRHPIINTYCRKSCKICVPSGDLVVCKDDIYQPYPDLCKNYLHYCGQHSTVDSYCKKSCKHCVSSVEKCNPSCANGGKCVESNSVSKCECPNGFSGNSCEISVCQKNPCQNGGKCVVDSSITKGFKCDCTVAAGLSGDLCERKTDCLDSKDICPYYVDHCNKNIAFSSMAGGGLIDQSCPKTCKICDERCYPYCRNGGKCVASNSAFKCECPNGYIGSSCQENVCQNNPCQNSGKCQLDSSLSKGFICSCTVGFMGDFCDQREPEKGLDPVLLTVECLMVVDKAAIEKHQEFLNTTDPNIVFPHMKLYFSHFMSQVNQIYEKSLKNDNDLKISVKLTNIIFQTEPTVWSYGAEVKPLYKPNSINLASPDVLATYLKSIKKDLNFNYDIAIGLTGKDICEGGDCSDPQSSRVMGVASHSGVCTEKNTVVVEMNTNGFFNVEVLAHEIGHSLGSNHDGEKNNCAKVDTIMGDRSSDRPNLFSSCSINYFKKLLLNSKLSDASTQAKCLKNSVDTSSTDRTRLWNVEDECKLDSNSAFCRLPGQIWSTNDICKMMFKDEYKSTFFSDYTCDSGAVCATSYGSFMAPALEGVGCFQTDSTIGKTCSNKKCTLNPVQTNQCSSGDMVITVAQQQKIGNGVVSNRPIDCDSYLDIIYSENKPNKCNNKGVLQYCCNACKKYQEIEQSDCQDQAGREELCANEVAKCTGGWALSGKPWSEACKRTCKTCQSPSLPLECKADTCKNGGSCVTDSTFKSIAFKCECPTGFFGALCEKKLPCQCKSGEKIVLFATGGSGCACVSN